MAMDRQQTPETMTGPTVPGPKDAGAAQPEAAQPTATAPQEHVIERTRISGVWAAIACFAVILVLLLVFIAQNSRTADVGYMGAHGHVSLGVAMLLAAVCGALLVILAGTARIMQLRATARKHRRSHAKAAKAAQPR